MAMRNSLAYGRPQAFGTAKINRVNMHSLIVKPCPVVQVPFGIDQTKKLRALYRIGIYYLGLNKLASNLHATTPG
jgi:hypothetical protein